MKIPKKIDLRVAILLFILAVILTISGASILFGKLEVVRASGLASASVGLSIQKPTAAPEEPETPTGPPSSSGGAGAGSLSPQIISVTQEIEFIPSGTQRVIGVADNVDTTVRMVSFLAMQDIEKVTFKTKDYFGKPAVVPIAPGVISKYLTAELESSAEEDTNLEISSTLITFRVSQKWLAENNVDPDTIILYRYTNAWDTLPTQKISETDEYVFFRSSSPGFSVFAVSGSKIDTGLNLVHEGNITSYTGFISSVPVVVGNIGDKDLTSVVLSAENAVLGLNVSPAVIDTLPAGSKGTFILTVNVPENTTPGTYTVTIRAKSGETAADSSLKVIIPSMQKPSASALLQEEINNLKQAANTVWEEAQWISLRGGNASIVFTLLNGIQDKLAQAGKNLGMVSLDETQALVDSARADLDSSVSVLAGQQKFLRLITLPSQLLFFTVVALVLVAGAFTLYLTSGRKKILKKVDQAIEEHRKALAEKESTEKARAKLVKQLSLVEESYINGFISEEVYSEAKEKIKHQLGQ